MSLKEYKNKRDFQNTPEPSGEDRGKKSRSRFVIQCHRASHLHFDFRLQIGDTLKSWAVPKGPSLNPADQRLAVYVEDHPLAYADFEGIIPEGEYGAGTVLIWDEGHYLERGTSDPDESMVRAKEGLDRGHITFILFGQRLQGEFALIRLKGSRNWLLVKKWDEYASNRSVALPMTSIRSGLDFNGVATDPKIWHSKKVSHSRRVRSDRLYQLAEHQAKAAPQPVAKVPAYKLAKPMLAEQLALQPDWLTEIFPKGERGLLVVNGKVSSFVTSGGIDLFARYRNWQRWARGCSEKLVLDVVVMAGSADHHLMILDVLYGKGRDFSVAPLALRLEERQRIAADYQGIMMPEGVVAGNHVTGVVLQRHLQSAYQGGIANSWIKGSLSQSKAVEKDELSPSPTPSIPAFTPDLGGLLEVGRAYQGTVRVAHGDKVFWPDPDVTKAHLFGYYLSVSSLILRQLRNRPLSVQRFPQGILHKGFFQKDFVGYLPKYVETLPISSKSSGRALNYLMVNNEETLLYLANLGVLEINPWLSSQGSLDRPDYAVVDLDPDDNAFGDLLELAYFIGDLLQERGVISFCKTSGGTGLHIFIPLTGDRTYDESRQICLTLAEYALAKFPKLASIERSPSRRRRKIYIDCFQNRRSQTIVSAYSPRPRAKAPVSTPVTWAEVEAQSFVPGDFTVATIGERLKQVGDLWEQIDQEPIAMSQLKQVLKKN